MGEDGLDLTNIPHGSDDINQFIREARSKEYSLTSDEDLVRQLQLIQQTLKADPKTIYYPCSGADISPSDAFPHARVIYVDIDPRAIEALKKNKYEAHGVSAEEFQLEDKADLVLLVNPDVRHAIPSQQVARNGLLVCNDYQNTASEVLHDDNFMPLGYIESGQNTSTFNENAIDRLKMSRNVRNMDELFVFRRK